MKKILIVGILIIIMGITIVSNACATPTEWHNMPASDNDQDDLFQLRFEILSDETTNYTITIDPGTQFSIVDGNELMTISIPVNATRTFIFDMKLEQDLEDGKHPIPYTAYKNGTEFKSGNAYVRAGTQAPGFELMIFLCGILFTIFMIHYRKHKEI
jgi:hypothetical protein